MFATSMPIALLIMVIIGKLTKLLDNFEFFFVVGIFDIGSISSCRPIHAALISHTAMPCMPSALLTLTKGFTKLSIQYPSLFYCWSLPHALLVLSINICQAMLCQSLICRQFRFQLHRSLWAKQLRYSTRTLFLRSGIGCGQSCCWLDQRRFLFAILIRLICIIGGDVVCN